MDKSLQTAAEIREQLSDRSHSDSTELHFEEVLNVALALPQTQRELLVGRLRKKRKPENHHRPIRLSRLNIFLGDFREARDFAVYIVSRGLYRFKDPQSKKRLLHRAFNVALIVSYSRAFRGSKDRQDAAKVSISEPEVNTVLDADEQRLHKRIVETRDQAFAHSDSIAHELEGMDYSGRTVMFYNTAREPLSREETKTLSRMIRKWIQHLEKLREDVRENFNQE
jgi:uncharacterized membrane protein